MPDSEETLLRESTRSLLRAADPVAVPGALAEQGWLDLLSADPALACTVLFEEQGGACASTPGLDLVVLDAAGIGTTRTAAVVWPDLQRSLEPSSRTSGGVLTVSGVVLAGWQRADEYLVPIAGDGDPVVVRVPADAVPVVPFAGLDASAGMALVRATVSGAAVTPTGLAWPPVVASAQRCIGHELVGLAAAMHTIACEHVVQRRQFGRPIGSLQTVRHRLADIHVAITAARSALAAAWTTDDLRVTWAAKSLAWRAAAAATRDGQQLCGAMGFTREHPLHRFVRRAQLVDCLLGPGAWLIGRLGRELADTREVPRIPSLT